MKLRLIVLVLFTGLLSGCSLFDSVNQSLNYVTEATTYVSDVSSFAEQLPTLAQDAITDPAALDQVTTSFEQMKETINQFSTLDAPAFAQDVHDQLTQYNEALLTDVDAYLLQLKEKTIDLEAIQQSQIVQTMSDITELMNQIQQLGQ